MNKEQKMIFFVTILPLLIDIAEELKDDFPNLFKQGLKKAINDFMREAEKVGHMVTTDLNKEEKEEIRQQYQDLFLVHLGISKEIIKNK